MARGTICSPRPDSYIIRIYIRQFDGFWYAIYSASEEWDNNTNLELFADYTVDYSADWDSSAPDGQNEMSFGAYSDSQVIAVTVIWGSFSGPVGSREIKEYDILFNTKYVWGDAGANPSVMDLQNIATHEIGHGIGLGDLYSPGATAETMYGYSTEGETKKRDLYTGDIQGLQSLYGI